MPDGKGVWVFVQKPLDQVLKRLELSGSEVVFWSLAVGGHATSHANSETDVVVAAGVCAGLVIGTSLLHSAVSANNVVVTDAKPPTLFVPTVDVLCPNVISRPRSGAVDDNEVDRLNGLVRQRCWIVMSV